MPALPVRGDQRFVTKETDTEGRRQHGKPSDWPACCGWSAMQPRSENSTRAFGNADFQAPRKAEGVAHWYKRIESWLQAAPRPKRQRAGALQDASRLRGSWPVRPSLWLVCDTAALRPKINLENFLTRQTGPNKVHDQSKPRQKVTAIIELFFPRGGQIDPLQQVFCCVWFGAVNCSVSFRKP